MQVCKKRTVPVKTKELRNETVKELQSRLADEKKKYMELRFQNKTGALNNPLQIRKKRREIARIMTIIKEKNNEE